MLMSPMLQLMLSILQLILSMQGHLVDTFLMSSAFKGCFEESLYAAQGFVGLDEASWHDEHIGVVVLACESGYLFHPYEGGADALVLVERHGDAFAASADAYAAFCLALFYGLGQCVTEVGVVATVLVIAAIVLVCYVVFTQILFHNLLQGEAGVVAC